MRRKPSKAGRTIRPSCTSDRTQRKEGKTVSRSVLDFPCNEKEAQQSHWVVWKSKSAMRGVPSLPEQPA